MASFDFGKILRSLFYWIPKTKLGAWLSRLQRGVHEIQKMLPNQQAVDLINQFMQALAIQDEVKRLETVLPLLHRSLHFEEDGQLVLARSVQDHSYPKAIKAVSIYHVPVKIHEVHRGQKRTVGAGKMAEYGRVDKYFIKPKDYSQRPVPIGIFWPDGPGDPKIESFGSL